ncbi:zf-C2H2 domain-containing protein/zf-C2H2_4 domain-containing protein [Cephalotus follicularis]|uniref:Zf-C2H2 domain-containing protein/zf-C2H2_4 domain-containing protein n=1 Tax=Cephalotus follicularis TaxID=3775 RepID=A0A1Q3C4K8_CEPFO|nr:zf-C2H2 domain-containing protein/zf-C2H2_4 domain-containing protein [Cephalotus follicularis]
METEGEIPGDGPIFRDIRRYYCDYCGICRSKKSLIASHILTHHKEETNNDRLDETEKVGRKESNTCNECGATFKKPAYLKQHMQSHSLERPFACPVNDCHYSYRRKDHLTRHLLQHKGKLFKCPIENCNHEFGYQVNMKRHVKEHHDEGAPSTDIGRKHHVCQEIGCGKVFKYASKLRKHEDSHVKLDSVEAFCSEPGCMKYFTNEQFLKAHIHSCHRYTTCNVCGTKQLRKNIKRHLRTHETRPSSKRIKCEFKGCLHTFSTKSNLRQHLKSAHYEIKPFVCCFPGCGMRFSYKHVRDTHEKAGCHVYIPGDFVESDEHFRSRPRGGRKRTCPTVEMLTRKRITPPSESDPITG